MVDLYSVVESILDDEDDIMTGADVAAGWVSEIIWSNDPIKNFIFRNIRKESNNEGGGFYKRS